ncbi:MAG: hypothetical protein WBW48_14475 [Anaerolineae bacterium]
MKLIFIPRELSKKLSLLAMEKDMTKQDLTTQLLWRVLERQELLGLLEHQGRLGPDVSKQGVGVPDALSKKLSLLAMEKDMTKQALTTQLLRIGLELVNASPTQRLNSFKTRQQPPTHNQTQPH